MVEEQQRSVWTQVAGIVNTTIAPGHTTVVRFRMEPGSVEPMVAAIRHNAAVAGAIVRFDLNRGDQDPGAFLICTRWTDHASWQAYQSHPNYAAFRERTAPFYQTKPDRTLWRPLR